MFFWKFGKLQDYDITPLKEALFVAAAGRPSDINLRSKE
jgi:hypothetical protein